MHHQTVYAKSAAILAAICVVSLAPLLVLYLEFRGIQFCNEAYWYYIAKFYGSYFLFPIFGIIVAVFLVVPLTVLWLILQLEDYKHLLRYVVYTWIGLIA